MKESVNEYQIKNIRNKDYEHKYLANSQFYKLLDQVYNTNNNSTVIDSLLNDLRQYSKSIIPDHIGFRTKIDITAKSLDDKDARYLGVTDNLVKMSMDKKHALLLLFYAYSDVIDGLKDMGQREIENHADEVRIMLNKWKLLAGLYSDESLERNDQSRKAMNKLLLTDKKKLMEDISDDIEQADGLEITARLQIAISNNLCSESNYLLGVLLNRRKNLLEGEYEYLRACVCLKSNEYKAAIKYASKVPEKSNDFVQSNYIILEALALQGDYQQFVSRLEEAGSDQMSSFYLVHLSQVLLRNMEDNFELQKQTAEKCLKYILNQGNAIYVDIGDAGCRKALRYRARLALEFFEEISNTFTYYDIENITDPSFLSPKGRAVLSALSIDAEYLNGLIEAFSAEKAFEYIHKNMCIPKDQPPANTYLDYDLLFEIQYKIQGVDAFLDTMYRNIKSIGYFPVDYRNKWLSRFYVDAQVSKYDKLDKLVELISEYDNKLVDGLANDVERARIHSILSDNGKRLFISANYQLDSALASDYGWKDAGMLSLGFFRIIENELNTRLISPLLNSLGDREKSYFYDDLSNRSLSNRQSTKANSEKLHSYYLFETLKPVLKRYGRNDDRWMMLGPMEYFLNSISNRVSTQECSKPVLNYLKSKLVMLLTDRGIEAIENDELGDLFTSNIRDKFRNPPAHAQYLHINTAVECRKYVHDCLLKIDSWIKATSSSQVNNETSEIR